MSGKRASSVFGESDYFDQGPQISNLFEAGATGDGGPGVGGSGGRPGVGGGGGGPRLVTTYTSGDPNVDDANEFNIQINFAGKWTPQQQAVVKWAADFWSQIITADVRDDLNFSGKLVDDIAITMFTGPIDGSGGPAGNTLALTGNFVVRDLRTVDQLLPLEVSILLDSTDLKDHSLSGTWDAIILHEMGHALGFAGFAFFFLGLTDDAAHFTGDQATAAYGGLVPLETIAGSHWNEGTFAPNGQLMSNELMTGFFAPGETTLLSDTTIGVLTDLGYHVQDPSVGSASMIVDSHLLVV